MNKTDNTFENLSEINCEKITEDQIGSDVVPSEKKAVIKNVIEDLERVLDIPLNMTIELGRTKMTIENLIKLNPGAVITLDSWVGEPLDILINGYLIAQGEIVVMAEKYGVRITDVVTPAERIQRLSR